jgi:hypothetical protein
MKMKKFKQNFNIILMWFIIIITSFAFLSLCNWNFYLSHWNGFSRFLLATEGILFLLNVIFEG